ncbi:MAG: hypothetical protein K0S39_2778 [Paenibacillus sp.]|jgi:hypothetical protein|nr:hypothetical protein [Paenibacillus sp.]
MDKKTYLHAGRLAVGLAVAIALAGCADEPVPPAQPPQALPPQAAVPGNQQPPSPAAGVTAGGQAAPAAAETASPGSSAPALQTAPAAPQGAGTAAAAQPPAPAAAQPSPAPQAAAPVTAPAAASQQPPASAASGGGDRQPPSALPAALPEAAPAAEQVKSAVQISITGDKEKGTILETTAIDFKEGDSVFDVLQRITKQKKIQMEHRGSAKTSYIEGIDNLYEFDKGGKSGWLYRVNGTFPNKSAGAYILQKGDRIEWVYTLDLGKDVGKSDNPKAGANPDNGGSP